MTQTLEIPPNSPYFETVEGEVRFKMPGTFSMRLDDVPARFRGMMLDLGEIGWVRRMRALSESKETGLMHAMDQAELWEAQVR